MKIIDTFQDMVDAFSNGPFNMDKWEKYADHISPSLTKKVKADCSDYHFETQILPVITHMLQNIEKAEQAHRSFVKAVKELPQKTADIFGEELEISIIFYLGLCNGAGWATDLNGQSVILMGIEKIVELNWCNERNMAGLLYHELGHIWHYTHRTVPTTSGNTKAKGALAAIHRRNGHVLRTAAIWRFEFLPSGSRPMAAVVPEQSEPFISGICAENVRWRKRTAFLWRLVPMGGTFGRGLFFRCLTDSQSYGEVHAERTGQFEFGDRRRKSFIHGIIIFTDAQGVFSTPMYAPGKSSFQ